MKAVTYYRVSTKRQGKSGLGLEAQRDAIKNFLGKDYPPIAEFTEIESGKNNSRLELTKALEYCKLTGATLVIAKLDRLSRNAAFLMTLRDQGVKFVAADMPEANNMTIGIMATIAQHEREMISQRTKAALQATKARGKTLGNPSNLTPQDAAKGRAMGRIVMLQKAKEYRDRLIPVLKEMVSRGLSLRGIVKELEKKSIVTLNGGRWHPTTIKKILEMA